MSEERPSFLATTFSMLEVLAQRATCPRLHTACVAVNSLQQYLVWGYNGVPRKMGHCDDVGCTLDEGNHCVRVTHAEINAICQAAGSGISIRDTDLVVLHLPCSKCAPAIIQAGFSRVLYRDSLPNYNNAKVIQYFEEAGVFVRRFDKERQALAVGR